MNEEMPLEIEKKFLIKMPNLKWIRENTDCKVARITQTYLGHKQNGFGKRVRRMTIDGETKFYLTSKKSISDMTRIEIEEEISKNKYYDLLLKTAKSRNLRKTRYIVSMNNLKYEIDVYPFWRETAILEIELDDEKQEYIIPDFLEIIGDVTGNKDYSNSSLAKKFKELEEVYNKERESYGEKNKSN